jgi:hypothetical protein
MRRIGTRHGHGRRALLRVVSLLGFAGRALVAQEAAPVLADPDVRRLHAFALRAEAIVDLCTRVQPTAAAAVRRAYSAWARRHGRATLDAVVRAEGAEADERASRVALRGLGGALLRGDAAARCADPATLFTAADNDLQTADREAHARALARIGDVSPTTALRGATQRAAEAEAPGTDDGGVVADGARQAPRGAPAGPIVSPNVGGALSDWRRREDPTGTTWRRPARALRGGAIEAVISLEAPVRVPTRDASAVLRRVVADRFGGAYTFDADALADGLRSARTRGGQPGASLRLTMIPRDPALRDASGGFTQLQVIVVIHADDRATVLHVVAPTSDFGRAGASFERWLPEAPIPGERQGAAARLSLTGPQPFAGLWGGSSLVSGSNPMGGFMYVQQRTWVTLTREGLVYAGIPGQGRIDRPDVVTLCAGEAMARCGSYRVSGDQLIFRFPDDGIFVADDTVTFDGPDATGDLRFSWGGVTLARVPPAPSMRLDGAYTWSIGGVGAAGAVRVSRTIRFTPDGRYAIEGGSALSISSGGTDVVGGSRRSGARGTYALAGYTLVLRPDDGAEERATIIVERDDRGVIETLVIDGEDYRR